MTITITSEKFINEIQEEFSRLFPFLKIEFFVISNYRSKETISRISNQLRIGDAYNTREPISMELSPLTVVRDFETDFESKFGMFAQLYRKSGNLWQEITLTDNWTLKQQDQTGYEISTIISSKPISKPHRQIPALV